MQKGFLSKERKKKRKGRERKEWITLSECAIRHCAGGVYELMSYILTIRWNRYYSPWQLGRYRSQRGGYFSSTVTKYA